jgi:head-tail adaptor
MAKCGACDKDTLRMRHRVTLQRVTRTANAMNEQEEAWADLGSKRWANVEGQSGREVRRANQTTPTATHQVTLRSDSITKGLTADDRIVWAGPGGDVTMGIVFVDLTQVRAGNRVVCLCEAAQ